MGLRERLRALIPTRQQIQGNRWLAWLGPWLNHPKLWHWSRRGVAMGVALGVFFGLLVPLAQIPLSVGAAVLLRANVAAAAASTLVTNPITFAPLYFAAYRLGAWVTGERVLPNKVIQKSAEEKTQDVSVWQRLRALGKPLLVGLAIISVCMGLLTYALITVAWRWRTLSKRRRRFR
jgi:uncharacterized protein (DUF2062 family)